MRIAQLRRDIKEVSQPILQGYGFTHVGELGEYIKTDEVGNRLSVLIDEIKDRNSFSISVRVFVRYENIEAIFGALNPGYEYTINKLLTCESIDFESYSKGKLAETIDRLISIEAIEFLTEYSSDKAILSNLTKADSKLWVTSDKVAQFKVKLASAVLADDAKALIAVKEEALTLCNKPWSVPYREKIRGLCSSV